MSLMSSVFLYFLRCIKARVQQACRKHAGLVAVGALEIVCDQIIGFLQKSLKLQWFLISCSLSTVVLVWPILRFNKILKGHTRIHKVSIGYIRFQKVLKGSKNVTLIAPIES